MPLAAFALLALSAAALPQAAAQDPSPCETYRHPDYGLVCDRGDGLLETFDDGGASMGLLHKGSDPRPAQTAGSEPDPPMYPTPGTRDPYCKTTEQYYTVVIYARATDDTDDYTAKAPFVRTLTKNADWTIDQAAQATLTGGHADIRVECSGGAIVVHNEVLSTAKASATFASIKSDLIGLGYNDNKIHYWVFYDEPLGSGACNAAGNIWGDSSPGTGNLNNGNGGGNPQYAEYWHCTTNPNDYAALAWLHEWGHNDGAVQLDAPHTTGAWHCTDGLDTMCYNDGGPSGGSYTTTSCGSEIFDCGKDDYFHRAPAGGSYLATHWNLGHTNNRYLCFSVDGGGGACTTDGGGGGGGGGVGGFVAEAPVQAGGAAAVAAIGLVAIGLAMARRACQG